mmetsp:Transcript_65367/g.211743  ORF Transcript_65367/g.211743 Transcript_65367/m.211743 type:complete len:270 (+) Transcript_65367:1783-2592(+)
MLCARSIQRSDRIRGSTTIAVGSVTFRWLLRSSLHGGHWLPTLSKIWSTGLESKHRPVHSQQTSKIAKQGRQSEDEVHPLFCLSNDLLHVLRMFLRKCDARDHIRHVVGERHEVDVWLQPPFEPRIVRRGLLEHHASGKQRTSQTRGAADPIDHGEKPVLAPMRLGNDGLCVPAKELFEAWICSQFWRHAGFRVPWRQTCVDQVRPPAPQQHEPGPRHECETARPQGSLLCAAAQGAPEEEPRQALAEGRWRRMAVAAAAASAAVRGCA